MSIELDSLSKSYGRVRVVDGVSLRIATGELFVLLGPSGSGKSTLLRMIAGLAEVDSGTVRLHGRDVTSVSPKDREIGFVFQHYGLFRHMTVAENIEFALRVRHVATAQRRERREELLRIVGLSGMDHRYPRQLSGGQQQRVALARALAHEPEVLLLDEPFGALDSKIRLELRNALRDIQRELKLTAVFVTHDQEEAFELADRLAVLRDGRLLEVGAPQELYLHPRSPFVATFLGAANLLVGDSSSRSVRLGDVELPLATEVTLGRTPRRTQVLFRPEDVKVTADPVGKHPQLGRGVVETVTSVGGFERMRLRLSRLDGVRAVSPQVNFGDGALLVDALRPQNEVALLPLKPGDEVSVGVCRFHVLAPASLRLMVDSGTTDASLAAARLGHALTARLEAHASIVQHEVASLDEVGLDSEWFEVGAETEHAEEGFDLLVLGAQPSAHYTADLRWLRRIRHHLLLVTSPAEVPSRILVCVTLAEHGKADIRFAERLAWQLGATTTVLTVLDEKQDTSHSPRQVERFMNACVNALAARGVVANSRVRSGSPHQEILAELKEGGYDLLVLGAPHQSREGRIETRSGVVQRILGAPQPCPVLLVRR